MFSIKLKGLIHFRNRCVMKYTLGIDAAWTRNEPSGVCLLRSTDGKTCEIVRLGKSYSEFVNGNIEWNHKADCSQIEMYELLKACDALKAQPDCIAVDMPIASYHIKERRNCETEISKAYGGKGASTHNPNENRPGLISVELFNCLTESGYIWMTSGMVQNNKSLIEVYPHTAIIEYLNLEYRYEYKVSKKNKFKSWASLSASQKNEKLIENLQNLVVQLTKKVPNIYDFFIHLNPMNKYSVSQLKGYEDAIDSVVCALVGMDFLFGNAVGYGNDKGTIWVPVEDVVL